MTAERDESLHDLASAFVLGTLPPTRRGELREHLSTCARCRAEVEGGLAVADELAGLLSDEDPGEGPWRAIRDAIAGSAPRTDAPRHALVQAWKDWGVARDGSAEGFVFAGETPWEETGCEGVEARRLFVDAAADRVTMLVRMAAGSEYPAHRHAGAEECYVIAGDIWVGDVHMRRGDYQRAPAGSRHPVQSTEAGCVLLLVSSLSDELD